MHNNNTVLSVRFCLNDGNLSSFIKLYDDHLNFTFIFIWHLNFTFIFIWHIYIHLAMTFEHIKKLVLWNYPKYFDATRSVVLSLCVKYLKSLTLFQRTKLVISHILVDCISCQLFFIQLWNQLLSTYVCVIQSLFICWVQFYVLLKCLPNKEHIIIVCSLQQHVYKRQNT